MYCSLVFLCCVLCEDTCCLYGLLALVLLHKCAVWYRVYFTEVLDVHCVSLIGVHLRELLPLQCYVVWDVHGYTGLNKWELLACSVHRYHFVGMDDLLQ